jgi:hypothetical protein
VAGLESRTNDWNTVTSKVTTNAHLDRLGAGDGGGLTNLNLVASGGVTGLVVNSVSIIPTGGVASVTIAAGGGGGLTNAALYHAAGDIVDGSTCYREGTIWTRFTTNTCKLLFRNVLIADSWATNLSWAVWSGAYSGVATTEYRICLVPSSGTTNVPTSFTQTNAVIAISGSINYTNGLPVTFGRYDISVEFVSGETNGLIDIERRANQ